MEWIKIKNRIQKAPDIAPAAGYVLAYTRQAVVFRKYDTPDDLDLLLGQSGPKGDILEIHLFDKEREYRVIASGSKRGILAENLGGIEHVAKFDVNNPDEVYQEKIMLEPAFCRVENGINQQYIIVCNHICYDQNGMAGVDDYRLIMEG